MRIHFGMVAGGVQTTDNIDLGVLREAVPPQLIDEVVDAAGCREQRRRLLPAAVTVYVVLALALFHAADGFRPPGYRAVLKLLAGRRTVIASAAAVTQARYRLGAKVLQLLFERVAASALTTATDTWHVFQRRLVAWDCTEIAVPDSPANATRFGYRGQSRVPKTAPTANYLQRQGSTPMLRLMMLIDCVSHTVLDACFDGSTRASEHDLARQLTASLRHGMLLLADRNFDGYDLCATVAATGADLLWRTKKNRIFTPTRHLPDGSFLAIMPTPAETYRCASARKQHLRTQNPRHGLLIRVIDYTITVTTGNGNQHHDTYHLITTLLDPKHAPATELAACYHQRWESETSYSFLKPRLLGTTTSNTLRSQTPDGITQEIYALLTVYHLLCALRTDAATETNCPPSHISFTVTLRAARASIHHHQHATRNHVIATIRTEPKLKRRNRNSPRKIRPRTTKYPNKPRDTPASTNIRYEINIQPRAA